MGISSCPTIYRHSMTGIHSLQHSRAFYQISVAAGSHQLAINRSASTALPRIAQPSFLRSLIPKPLRRSQGASQPVVKTAAAPTKSKEWNPYTFYIVMFLLIGSNSINLIALRNDHAAFMRKTDAKITLLHEVIGRFRAGEEVDVKRVLGTGDEAQEKEWEEALQEIERDATVWRSREEKESLKEAKKRAKEVLDQEQAGKAETVSVGAEGALDANSRTSETPKSTKFKAEFY